MIPGLRDYQTVCTYPGTNTMYPGARTVPASSSTSTSRTATASPRCQPGSSRNRLQLPGAPRVPARGEL
eukprot:2327748-Rhodomonas_salina.3